MDPFHILIPYRNGQATLGRLLDSLPERQPVIVIDDLSDPPLVLTAEQRRRWPAVQVMRLRERGYFAGAVNRGMAACAGDALILNQDMALEGTAWLDWLAERQGQYAIMGHGQLKHPAWPAGYVQGQFMYLDRAAWSAVGNLNARDYPLWGCTAEWQVRACRRGYKALPVGEYPPGVTHLRLQGESFGESIRAALDIEPERQEWLVRTPPLVSVIITSLSYGRYLPDCIHSLIGGPTSLGTMPGQTLQSFEAIIVDDGSHDETAEIGQALANPWQAIRYIRRSYTGGTPAANNTGIRASYGRYLSILCADDMREPDSLEGLYRVVEADSRAVAYDDIYQFANGQRTIRQELGEYGFDSLVQKNMMHAGIMFSRRAFDATGGYDERMREGREDWQFNVALGLKGYCGKKAKQTGYLYRREGQNRSLTNTGGEWFSAFRNQMAEIFPALYRGVKPMGCCGGGGASQDAFRSANQGFGGDGAVAQAAIGQGGMVLLDYHGGNSGSEPWYGPITRARYLFGGSRTQGYVDPRDVEGMVKMRDRGRQVFSMAEAPTPPAGLAPLADLSAAFEPAMPGLKTVAEFGQLRTLAPGEKIAPDAIEPPVMRLEESAEVAPTEAQAELETTESTRKSARKSAAPRKPRASKKG